MANSAVRVSILIGPAARASRTPRYFGADVIGHRPMSSAECSTAVYRSRRITGVCRVFSYAWHSCGGSLSGRGPSRRVSAVRVNALRGASLHGDRAVHKWVERADIGHFSGVLERVTVAGTLLEGRRVQRSSDHVVRRAVVVGPGHRGAA